MPRAKGKIPRVVASVLMENEETRHNNELLYWHVLRLLVPDGKADEFDFCTAIRNRKDLGLPSFDAVIRARHRIKQAHPELFQRTEGSADIIMDDGTQYIDTGIKSKRPRSSLCWNCANAYGGCSWTEMGPDGGTHHKPVAGWTAELVPHVYGHKADFSYRVLKCPEFIPDER